MQSVDYTIAKYTHDGQFLKVSGDIPDHFQEPELLTKEIKRDQRKYKHYRSSLDYIQDVFYEKGLLFILTRTSSLSEENEDADKHIIDIFDAETLELVRSGIASIDEPLMNVKNGEFFFKSVRLNEKTNEVVHSFVVRKLKSSKPLRAIK